MSRWVAASAVALLLLGAAKLARGSWILAKAVVAQQLLEEAWDRARAGSEEPVPWPWADTWPVARLQVPDLGIDQIVLEGATGAVLAFGPGRLAGSARPGREGNLVLAGHRDTHFRFLRELLPGDRLRLSTPDGRIHLYRVESVRIVHEREIEVLEPSDRPRLTLITCFPFEAAETGGPLRYVVLAEGAADPSPARIADAGEPMG